MSNLKGINLAMQTPMFDDGSVDYARWQELIDIYIDAGVQGLVLATSSGAHMSRKPLNVARTTLTGLVEP